MQSANKKISTLIPTLLSIPFKRLGLEKTCEKMGWKKQDAHFIIDNELFLKAYFKSAGKNSLLYAVCIPLFFWKGWAPENYKDFMSYEKDRDNFNNEFNRISKILTNIFGNPLKKGKKANYDKETLQTNGWLLVYYHYAAWQIGKRWVVLQQCERDQACGVEISLWILPQEKESDLPPLPITVSQVYKSYC